ncbi:MAG TPA: hypothetical protein VFS43_10635 [Polyangiaceae bacterium]|nr:hypothetical protein [Polyangiaceae bacterium]
MKPPRPLPWLRDLAARLARRRPAARPAEAAREDPLALASGALIAQLNGRGWAPPYERWALGPAVEERFDPPGLLHGVAIVSSVRWFYQYTCHSLLFFERDGERYVYVPAAPAPDASATRLTRLAGYGVADSARWVAFAGGRFEALQGLLPSAPPAEAVEPDVDAAPWLGADLARVAASGDAAGLGAALGLLDVLAGFRGVGRDDLRAPEVLFGRDAVERLAARSGAPPPGHVCDALLDDARGAAAAGGAYRSAGAWRRAALVDRRERYDNAHGGYEAQLALVSLTASPGDWRYERRVLWSETNEGTEMS